MKNAKEDLMTYILNLTEEQADRLVGRLGLLKQIVGMKDHQQVYLETLVDRLFGKAGA